MFNTKVTENTKKEFNTKYVTNVQKARFYTEYLQEKVDPVQVINKVMFIGLTITAVAIFYAAISSLML